MYKYIVLPNKVIAISTYAGKTVRGVAKCDPRDEFDVEVGKRLAEARCNAKVAAKRLSRAIKKADEAEHQIDLADAYHAKMVDYFNDAGHAYDAALAELSKLEDELHK